MGNQKEVITWSTPWSGIEIRTKELIAIEAGSYAEQFALDTGQHIVRSVGAPLLIILDTADEGDYKGVELGKILMGPLKDGVVVINVSHHRHYPVRVCFTLKVLAARNNLAIMAICRKDQIDVACEGVEKVIDAVITPTNLELN